MCKICVIIIFIQRLATHQPIGYATKPATVSHISPAAI